MSVEILTGDCRALLAPMEPDSFDACVCDPPYHLTSIVKRFGAENGGRLTRVERPGRVLDPFCGTGSTLVACDRLGVNAIGIEQDAQTVADANEEIRRFRARRAIGDVAERPAPLPGQQELSL